MRKYMVYNTTSNAAFLAAELSVDLDGRANMLDVIRVRSDQTPEPRIALLGSDVVYELKGTTKVAVEQTTEELAYSVGDTFRKGNYEWEVVALAEDFVWCKRLTDLTYSTFVLTQLPKKTAVKSHKVIAFKEPQS